MNEITIESIRTYKGNDIVDATEEGLDLKEKNEEAKKKD